LYSLTTTKISTHSEFLSETPKEWDQLGDLGVDGKLILKWILNKQDTRTSAGFIWHRIQTSSGHL
jgi:hypothetical protein